MDLFWVECPGPGRLAVATRPRGNDWLPDDIAAARECGVTVIVSALEDHESSDLGLESEEQCCIAAGVGFLSVAVADRGVPSAAQANEVKSLARLVESGEHLAIHCRQALGRAPTLAVAILVVLGVPVAEAWRRVEHARGCTVPETDQQRSWPQGLERPTGN